MREELLYFVWQLQKYDQHALATTGGQPLTILAPGVRNAHSGPDFANARLRVDHIEWFGSVEIHIRSSDWNAHRHQYDEAYNRVVLHVVWEDDCVVYREDGTTMPTLQLKNRVALRVLQNYQQLTFQDIGHQAIPCAPLLSRIESVNKVAMLERAGVLRLERKSKEVLQLLEKQHGDWSVTAYQTLLRSFGFRVNAAPFEQLSYALPLSLIVKYQHQFDSLVALLLGQAGLLSEEDWPERWLEAYRFLGMKHQLQKNALSRSQWKFFRTRPANFPTVRIVQLAALLASCEGDITPLFEVRSVEEYHRLFKQGSRWLPATVSALGQSSIDKLIINAIVPYRFAYGMFFGRQEDKDQAVELLVALPGEKNQLVNKYGRYGFARQSAFDTQAILELDHSFCQPRQCLSCSIGSRIVKDQEMFVTSVIR